MHRDRLYAEGKCRSCELPLLDEEIAADARNCGVCLRIPVKVITDSGGKVISDSGAK